VLDDKLVRNKVARLSQFKTIAFVFAKLLYQFTCKQQSLVYRILGLEGVTMGLLRQLFKKKAEASPPPSVNQAGNGVKDLQTGLETLTLHDTSGQKTAAPLPNSSTGQPWEFQSKHGGQQSPPLASMLGENPLDAVVDIEATSLEAVDYTHEEEMNLNSNHQEWANVQNEQPPTVANNNVVEEGVQVDVQELEDLQSDDTAEDSTIQKVEEEIEEQLATTPMRHTDATAATAEVDDGDASPPSALVDDLSISLAPLQTVVYLTEDNENMADAIPVISDGGGVAGVGVSLTNEKATAELVEELSELGRALETMEAEGPPGSPSSAAGIGNFGGGSGVGSFSVTGVGEPQQNSASVAGAAAGNGGNTVQQPSSPGGSMSTTSVSVADGARFSSNMVKLYNDLALRLMDAKEYDQALQMLSKAEGILDNDAAWSPPPGIFAAGGSGSLDSSNGGAVGGSGGVGGGSSSSNAIFDRNFSGSFNLGSAQESSLDEAAFNALGGAVSGMDAVQNYLDRIVAKRNRLRAITYNNIGCLYKRRSLPERALSYLQNALALEEAAGDVHDCASTHLNLCASYSALTRFREALAHAERAIILLQRQLWGPTAASFQDGMTYLGRVLAALAATVAAGPGGIGSGTDSNAAASSTSSTTAAAAAAVAATYAEAYKRQRKLLASANILAMAYHNAAVEHERLNRLREAQVSYSRACSIGTKFLGPKSSTTVALLHAQKGFVARQQREAGGTLQTHHSTGGEQKTSGTKGHVMTSRSSTNLTSKARQGSSTTKRTPLTGASSSSRMAKSSSSSIASKLSRGRRD
jgi:tetratricopeptide (TPR) repeat protein